MPTYEYQCDKCKKAFDAFQSMKDDAFSVCPKEHCQQKTWGKGKVRRLLGTGAGLIFKGSGFYITDYRSEGYKTAAKKESGSGGGGEGSSGGGGEGSSGGASTGGEAAKTAPKTESKPAPAEKKSKPGGKKE